MFFWKDVPNPNLGMITARDSPSLGIQKTVRIQKFEDFLAWLGPTWSFRSSSTWTVRAASWFITWRWSRRVLRVAPSARISRTGFWCGPAWSFIPWSTVGPSWRCAKLVRDLPKNPGLTASHIFPNGSHTIYIYTYIYTYIYIHIYIHTDIII